MNISEESLIAFLQELNDALGPDSDVLLDTSDGSISITSRNRETILFDLISEDCVVLQASAGGASPVTEPELIEALAEAAKTWFQLLGVSFGMIPEVGNASITKSWPIDSLEQNVEKFAEGVLALSTAASVWASHLEDVTLAQPEDIPHTELAELALNLFPCPPDLVKQAADCFVERGYAESVIPTTTGGYKIEMPAPAPALLIEGGNEKILVSIELPETESHREQTARDVLTRNFLCLGSQGETYAMEPGSNSIFAMGHFPVQDVLDLDAFMDFAARLAGDSMGGMGMLSDESGETESIPDTIELV